MNPDGSYGKSTVNSDAGREGPHLHGPARPEGQGGRGRFTSLTRIDGHPLFYAGKVGYVMIGAWVESAMKQAGATFPVTYANIPPFAGQKPRG